MRLTFLSQEDVSEEAIKSVFDPVTKSFATTDRFNDSEQRMSCSWSRASAIVSMSCC